MNDSSFGHLFVSIFAGIFTGSLTDAQNVVAGSGWSPDGSRAINGSDPMCIVFESQLVGPNINPAATFGGTANSTEIDGTILVAAYSLTTPISGGGSGGGGGITTGPVFLGSVTEVDELPSGATDVFIGTVTVVDSVPAGAANPYLGRIRSGSPSGSQANPSLSQVVIVGSAPISAEPYLGTVQKS